MFIYYDVIIIFDNMSLGSQDSVDSSVLEFEKFLGIGWEPISVRMERTKKGPNHLEQTITISCIRRKQAVEGEKQFCGRSNLRLEFLMEDGKSSSTQD